MSRTQLRRYDVLLFSVSDRPGTGFESGRNFDSTGQLPATEVLKPRPADAASSAVSLSPKIRGVVFGTLLLFTAWVSVHDALLVALHDGVIAHFEKNPIGRWLIELGQGEVWLFLALKLLSTSLVCSVLVTLYRRRTRIAFVAATAIAAFQLGLLLYLYLP